MSIHVDEQGLIELKNALGTAGGDYKEKLAKLTVLIEEITNGDIQGDPATDLLQKFRAKEPVFKGLLQAIEDAEEYMGIKGKKFDGMIGDLHSTMK